MELSSHSRRRRDSDNRSTRLLQQQHNSALFVTPPENSDVTVGASISMRTRQNPNRNHPNVIASIVDEDRLLHDENEEERILQQLMNESVRAEQILVSPINLETSPRRYWLCKKLCFVFIAMVSGLSVGIIVGFEPWNPKTNMPTASDNESTTLLPPSRSPTYSFSPTTDTPTTLDEGQRGNQIMQILKSYNAFNETALATSRHRRDAYEWLISVTPSSSSSSIHEYSEDILQHYVIALFYFSTKGPTLWAQPLIDTSLPACSLPQIVCDTSRSISALELTEDIGLVGTIPSELFLLTRLTYLDLRGNRLDSTIPTELCQANRLEEIWLMDNYLTGPIPNCIGALTRLRHLQIQRNDLTGTIPNSLNRCTSLTHLYLKTNDLSGTLPSLENLVMMRDLKLTDNTKLRGTIPSTWGYMKSLETIWLSREDLSGTVPSELTALSFLERFFVYNHPHLYGSLPTFPNAVSLRQVRLFNNSLTGSLEPILLRNISTLDELILRNNRLSGTIPNNFPSSLTELRLLGNNFVGSIPDSLSRLEKLQQLDIEENDLTSTIATTLCLLTGLLELKLANNRLSGQIPSELGLLDKLEQLTLQGNKLTGTVPSELRQNTILSQQVIFDALFNDQQ